MLLPRSSSRIVVMAAFFALLASPAYAILAISGSTSTWTILKYGGTPSNDPSVDQQTGSSESDIVGNSLHPSVYTTFDNAGTPSLTDGTVAFRVRLGADSSPAGFKAALFVGIDANADGKLDLFLGVCNSGSQNLIGIWDPGTGLNVSPSTTSMVSPAGVSYTETAANYNWTAVNTTIDPSVGTATDINADGNVDYFLSFSLPFADVVAQLAAKGINITENSTLSYVIGTATQDNSLNQDLNGVNGSVNSSSTWGTLGAITDPIAANGLTPVPEMNPAAISALVTAGAALFAMLQLQQRRRRAAKA